MRFVGGFDRVRCDARPVFDYRDDVTVIVAHRRVRQPNENLRAVFVQARRSFVMRKISRDRRTKYAFKRGSVTGGQQACQRLAGDFAFGEAVEALRARTPRLHRAVERKAEHRVFGRRQNCGEQMLGPHW